MAKKRSERRISIRSIRRDPPDYQKLGRAFLALAMAQAEAEAQAEDAEAKKRALKTDAENTNNADPGDES